MSAATIIAEIQGLPPAEQAKVLNFVRAIDQRGPWTGPELVAATEQMVAEQHHPKAEAMWERIARGFYGEKQDA